MQYEICFEGIVGRTVTVVVAKNGREAKEIFRERYPNNKIYHIIGIKENEGLKKYYSDDNKAIEYLLSEIKVGSVIKLDVEGWRNKEVVLLGFAKRRVNNSILIMVRGKDEKKIPTNRIPKKYRDK